MEEYGWRPKKLSSSVLIARPYCHVPRFSPISFHCYQWWTTSLAPMVDHLLLLKFTSHRELCSSLYLIFLWWLFFIFAFFESRGQDPHNRGIVCHVLAPDSQQLQDCRQFLNSLKRIMVPSMVPAANRGHQCSCHVV